ncbi:hypothetical protein [Rhodococcus opacus]|uniref:hypothetical protein n=1 Tax=Rhodococcus opacus TaxID=37919 RepID=UPI0012FD382A|nr:hypothetical protein [Rhodococcus opacus]UOT01395.1 hypothetical protein MPY17_20485 [Rhodococcus opacus]
MADYVVHHMFGPVPLGLVASVLSEDGTKRVLVGESAPADCDGPERRIARVRSITLGPDFGEASPNFSGLVAALPCSIVGSGSATSSGGCFSDAN